MGNQRFTAFEAQREEGSVRFNSKGSAEAAVDRIFAEAHQIDRAEARPHHATAAVTLMGYIFGQAHPDDAYVFLVGAELVGMNDTHEMWQLLWRVDMQAWAIAAGVGNTTTWCDLLSKDGYSHNDEYGDDSTTITWRFDVVNPASYTKAAKNSAHPDVATAKLVSESMVRDGFLAHVTRRYEKLAALTDWDFDEETFDEVSTIRQIVHSVSQPTAPTAGNEVTQRSLGTAFSLRVTRQINSGSVPTTYSYYDFLDYQFPRLLSDVDTYILDTSYRFAPRIRAAYGKKVQARINVTFHTTLPSPSSLFQLYPVDWDYDGFGFTVHVQNIITNSWSFSAISTSDVEIYVGQASSPTYTTYAALVGTEVLINERVTPWKFGLWRRSRFYIVLE